MLPSYNFNQLFPFDLAVRENNQKLEAQLKFYETILNVAIECCDHWHHRHYSLFDALVSENACQIRTFWIISNALNGSIQTENLKGNCLTALELVKGFLKLESLRDSLRNRHLLGDLFQRHNLEVNLSQDEMFLFLTFLLCKMIDKPDSHKKKEISLVMTDKANLKCFSPNIGTNQANSLNYKSRVLLSQLSVEYIKNLGLAYYPQSYAILFQENRQTEARLPIFPMFWTYDILLNQARKEGIPLLVYTKFASQLSANQYELRDEEVALFESKNSIYELVPNTNFCERPVCVIEGITVNNSMSREEWLNLVVKYGIYDIVLAGAAHHRKS